MTVTIDYLEDERKKLWAEIVELKKLKETIQEAKNDDSQEQTNDIKIDNNSLENISGSIQEISQKVNSMKSVLDEKSLEIEKIYSAIININQNYNEELKKYSASITNEKISAIEDIKAEIAKTNDIIKDVVDNMQSFKAKSLEHRNGIDKIYNEIFGTPAPAPQDAEEKEKLNEEYDKLNKNLETLKEDFMQLKNDKGQELQKFKNEQDNELNKLKEKIKTLMSDAMNMGLSTVYNQKKKKEEKAKTRAVITFNLSLMLLLIVSALPVGVFIFLYFYMEYPTTAAIKHLPMLFGLIAPLYLPLVWLGVVSNKKINQSKKMVEEYAQKEAISKSYENLSKEVEKPNSEDLKEKLVQNIIITSTESPEIINKDIDKTNYPMKEAIYHFANLLKTAQSPDELQSIANKLVIIERSLIKKQKPETPKQNS